MSLPECQLLLVQLVEKRVACSVACMRHIRADGGVREGSVRPAKYEHGGTDYDSATNRIAVCSHLRECVVKMRRATRDGKHLALMPFTAYSLIEDAKRRSDPGRDTNP